MEEGKGADERARTEPVSDTSQAGRYTLGAVLRQRPGGLTRIGRDEDGEVYEVALHARPPRTAVHPRVCAPYANVAEVVEVIEAGSACHVVSIDSGTTLANLLATWPSELLPLEEAIRICTGIAGGLSSLHRAGRFHGSLDATTVALDEKGDVVLLDASPFPGGADERDKDLRDLDRLMRRLLPHVPDELESLLTGPVDPEAASLRVEEVAERLKTLTISIPPPSSEVQPPTTRALIGRAAEVARLRGLVDEAVAGRGGLVLIAGEPGIGKTTLAQDICDYARARGLEVMIGACEEMARSRPFAPWIEALRMHVANRGGPDSIGISTGGDRVARLLPELNERFGSPPGEAVEDSEAMRFQLFDAVTNLLKRSAATRPILLVLEDLHWADDSSIRLLRFLMREIVAAPLLIITTYRDEGFDRDHPLGRALHSFASESSVVRLFLTGLDVPDVASILERHMRAAPDDELVGAVHRGTEGNPLFVTEVARLLSTQEDVSAEAVADRIIVPEGIRQALRGRLGRLSEPARGILSLASVAGREFELSVLRRLWEQGDQVLDLLEEGLAARVIDEVPESVGRYAFTHALVREVIYESIPEQQRRKTHLRIARLLERTRSADADRRVSDLALHFRNSGSDGLPEAVRYCSEAGRSASQRFAYAEAEQMFSAALAAADLLDDFDALARCDLLLAKGQAETRAGKAVAARGTFFEAARLARDLADPRRFALAALGFGPGFAPFGVGESDEELIALLEEALSLDQDDGTRARLLSRLGVELYFGEATADRHRISGEAVALARRVRDPATLAFALNSRHHALWSPEGLQERLTAAKEMVRLARSIPDDKLEMLGHNWLLIDSLEVPDREGFDRSFAAFSRVSRKLRQPAYTWLVPLYDATIALLEGRLSDAEASIERAYAMGSKARHENALLAFGTQLVALRTEQNRSAEVVEAIEGYVDHFRALPVWRMKLIETYLDTGEEAKARGEFDRLCKNGIVAAIPRDLAWGISTALGALVAARFGDEAQSRKLYESMLPFRMRHAVAGPGVLSFGSMSRYLGIAATTMGDLDRACRHFVEAIGSNERMGATAWALWAKHDLAVALGRRRRAGDAVRALALVDQVIGPASERGMKRLVACAVEQKLRTQGIDDRDRTSSIRLVGERVEEERPDLSAVAGPDGTVTILFTDIQGFTSITEALGDAGAYRLVERHNLIVRESLQRYAGSEIQSLGDGFMLAFGDPVAAVRCAVDIQRSIASSDLSGEVLLRMGLHTGDAIRSGDLLFGRTVIKAARVADAAVGGEILLSAEAAARVRGLADMTVGEVRCIELAGLAGDHEVTTLLWHLPE